MNDDRADQGEDQRGRDALIVLLGVFVVGLLLIGTADRLLHFGPALGNALFVALPLVAAAAARLRQDS